MPLNTKNEETIPWPFIREEIIPWPFGRIPNLSSDRRTLVPILLSASFIMNKKHPPDISIHVVGQVTSSGWTEARLETRSKGLGSDGVLELDFTASPPSDGQMVVQILEIKSSFFQYPDAPPEFYGVRIFAGDFESGLTLSVDGPQEWNRPGVLSR